jgi:CheY-like chemotaxis protein
MKTKRICTTVLSSLTTLYSSLVIIISTMIGIGRDEKGSMSQPAKCILFIDDDQDLLSLMDLSLQGLGFRVLTAASGKQGLEILATQPVDLIVLDYRMPDMDGAVVARETRQIAPSTPIIMYSGALEQVPDGVLELVDEFVSKQEPISTLLYHIPRVALRARRAPRAFPRYSVQISFFVIDSDGLGDIVFCGESTDLSEGGIGGVLDGEVPAGKLVRLQLVLPDASIDTDAAVRHRLGQRHGFQFLHLTVREREAIRRSLPA